MHIPNYSLRDYTINVSVRSTYNANKNLIPNNFAAYSLGHMTLCNMAKSGDFGLGGLTPRR